MKLRGTSLAEMIFKRSLRTKFDPYKPNIQTRVQERQRHMKVRYDSHTQARPFKKTSFHSPTSRVTVTAGDGAWMPGSDGSTNTPRRTLIVFKLVSTTSIAGLQSVYLCMTLSHHIATQLIEMLYSEYCFADLKQFTALTRLRYRPCVL